jgi:hypothetical protein
MARNRTLIGVVALLGVAIAVPATAALAARPERSDPAPAVSTWPPSAPPLPVIETDPETASARPQIREPAPPPIVVEAPESGEAPPPLPIPGLMPGS